MGYKCGGDKKKRRRNVWMTDGVKGKIIYKIRNDN